MISSSNEVSGGSTGLRDDLTPFSSGSPGSRFYAKRLSSHQWKLHNLEDKIIKDLPAVMSQTERHPALYPGRKLTFPHG